MRRSQNKERDRKRAIKRLYSLMEFWHMCELTGDPLQTAFLLERFPKDLTPHDSFWETFAHLVQTAFPKGLTDNSVNTQELARMTHQLRYVFDACMVRYIRTHYKGIRDKNGDYNTSDEGKLVQYFRDRKARARRRGHSKLWDTSESDRLHQKHMEDGDRFLFPVGANGVNIKITCNFHVEFILQNCERGYGSFAYILDPSVDNQNSILNGSSFNYADSNDYHPKEGKEVNHKKSRHYNLDIETGKVLDPQFRRQVNKSFVSPSRERYLTAFKPRSDQSKLLFENLIKNNCSLY